MKQLIKHYNVTNFFKGLFFSLSLPYVFDFRLFGDESDLNFWTVASHYLQLFAQARQLSVTTEGGSEETQPASQNHLDICHDILCECSYFQVRKKEAERIIWLCFHYLLRKDPEENIFSDSEILQCLYWDFILNFYDISACKVTESKRAVLPFARQ